MRKKVLEAVAETRRERDESENRKCRGSAGSSSHSHSQGHGVSGPSPVASANVRYRQLPSVTAARSYRGGEWGNTEKNSAGVAVESDMIGWTHPPNVASECVQCCAIFSLLSLQLELEPRTNGWTTRTGAAPSCMISSCKIQVACTCKYLACSCSATQLGHGIHLMVMLLLSVP